MLDLGDEKVGSPVEVPWRWFVVGVMVVLLVGAIARLADRRADVRLSFRAEGDKSVVRVSTAHGRVLPLEVADDACYRRVVITATGPGGVSMKPPFTSQGGRLADLSQFSCSTGDWRVVGEWSLSSGWRGGEWSATTPGSVLQWSGHAANLELEFTAAPPGGGVTVVADGVVLPPIQVDGGGGITRVAVPTRARLATGMVPVSEFPAMIELSADAEPLSVAVVSDGHTVYECDLSGGNGPVRIPAIPYPSSGTYARRTAVLVVRAVCVNGLFFLLGARLCASIFASHSAVVAVAASWAAGMSLTILLATSLNYALPGAVATILAIIAVIGAGIKSGGVGSSTPRETGATAEGVRGLSVLLALGLAGALFAFAPVITEHGWFIGHSLTDSADYIAWSERLSGVSLAEASIAPWRIADLTTLVTISTLTGVNTREGYAIAAFTFLVMLPLLTHAILDVLAVPPSAAACGAVMSASLSIYPQLFDYSYFAQYINAFVLHAGMLAACLLIDPTRQILPGRWWQTQFALAGPLALGVAMYPYQAIPPIVFIMWLLASAILKRSQYSKALLITQCSLALVLTNRSLAIGIDFFQSKLSTFGYLDALARNIVFPFHTSFKFLCIVAGCRDITMVHTYWPSIAALTGTRLWWMPLYASSSVMGVVVMVLFLAMILGLCIMATRRSATACYVASVYGAFVFATLALFVTNHTYSYGKFMLACGTLVAVPAAIGLVAMARGTHCGSYIVFAFLSLFMFFNMCSTVLDQSLGRVSRASPFLFNKRTHLSAVDIGLRDLERWAQTLPQECRVGIVGNYARASYADTDRVLYNRMLHALRNADVEFQGNTCPIYTAAFQFGIASGPVNWCSYDYLVVFRGYELLCELQAEDPASVHQVLQNKVFRVFRAKKGSGECVDQESPILSMQSKERRVCE